MSPLAARLLTSAALLEPELRQAILVISRVGEGALRKKLRIMVVRPRMRAVRRTARVRSLVNVMVKCIEVLKVFLSAEVCCKLKKRRRVRTSSHYYIARA